MALSRGTGLGGRTYPPQGGANMKITISKAAENKRSVMVQPRRGAKKAIVLTPEVTKEALRATVLAMIDEAKTPEEA